MIRCATEQGKSRWRWERGGRTLQIRSIGKKEGSAVAERTIVKFGRLLVSCASLLFDALRKAWASSRLRRHSRPIRQIWDLGVRMEQGLVVGYVSYVRVVARLADGD